MKIISNREYDYMLKEKESLKMANDMLKQNLKALGDELNKAYNELEIRDNDDKRKKIEIEKMLENNRNIANKYESAKKEIRNLKTLLTRNKINYKKGEMKNGRNK